jgi:ABC-type transport system substrate-binding protein
MLFSLTRFEKFRLPLIWTLSTISIFLSLHLVGAYFYSGGTTVGIPGGSINIGLVGKAPEIPNPLEYGQNKQHDLILSFLFRGMITYDHTLKQYEWDLGRCDLSDLSKVTCTLTGSGKWSDGTTIQTEDIIATYQAFKDNPPNEKMKVFLGKVAIVSPKDGSIELSVSEKNSLMLDLLTYPILRSDIIDRVSTNRLSANGYVTSGGYTFVENEKNSQYGYERITLGKNEKSAETGWLDKYNFLFFPDITSLERWADILGIIVPPDTAAAMLLGPRFGEYEYALQEYIGLFLHTDRLSNSIRKHLLLQSEAGLSGTVADGERSAMDLFPRSRSIKLDKNLSDVLREIGYKKIDEELAMLETNTGTISGATVVYPNNIYFDTPSKKSIFFSEAADGNIAIGGNVPVGTKSVAINGYTLKEFVPGNNRFTYRTSLEDGTLKEGKNTYTLEFESANGTKTTRDTLTLYYFRDKAKIEETQKQLEQEYLATLNTPEKIAERVAKITAEKERIKALNPRFYYNTKSEPYTVKLTYLSDPRSLETYATKIAETIENLGIQVQIEAISSKDFSQMLQKWEKNYDLLVIGFEATGQFSRIGQIFLSTEAKDGINFAKIESKALDGLFAGLRTSDTTERSSDIMKKIGDFMQGEAFFLPISSPLHTIYIDKNLKGIRKIDTFQDITTLADATRKASIKEEYILSLEGKSIGGFFSWFLQALLP